MKHTNYKGPHNYGRQEPQDGYSNPELEAWIDGRLAQYDREVLNAELRLHADILQKTDCRQSVHIASVNLIDVVVGK